MRYTICHLEFEEDILQFYTLPTPLFECDKRSRCHIYSHRSNASGILRDKTLTFDR